MSVQSFVHTIPILIFQSAQMNQLSTPRIAVANVGTTQGCCFRGCGGKVRIPHKPYIPSRGAAIEELGYPPERVNFVVRNRCGISVSEAQRRIFTDLDRRDDVVFPDARSSLSVRFEWPGYGSWSKQIRIKDWRKDSNPVSRSELACKIARLVPQFIEDMQDRVTDRRWRVGPGFIEADHLEIDFVKRVSKGSCQPYFCLKSSAPSSRWSR